MANIVYTQLGFALASSTLNLGNDTIKVALVSDVYVPNADHRYFNEVNTSEVAGAGYVAGGNTIVLTPAYDAVTDTTRVTAPDVTWPAATITARYGILYKDSGDPATSSLLLCADLGGNQSSVEGNFTIQWSDGVVFTLTQGA